MTENFWDEFKLAWKTATPEQKQALVAKLPKQHIDAEYRKQLVALVHTITPEGFLTYCELLDSVSLPDHVQDEVRKLFNAHELGLPYSLNGWRGSYKSVTFGVKFISWIVGNFPHLTNVIVGAEDTKSNDIAEAIALIIEYHPVWKECFPNVVPEKSRWSSEGYWVVNTNVSREEWEKQMASTIDPTFIGGGYQSRSTNGKHPTGVLYSDDMHDINNSTSDNQRNMVVKTYFTVTLKTAIRKEDKLATWVINVGVPWGDDIHQHLKNAGAITQDVPAMRRAKEGDPGAVYMDGKNPANGKIYDDIVGWWILTEPERFGVNSILSERSFGKAEFWQMIMLDLSTAREGGLRYYIFPHDKIDRNWPMQGGADPAYTLKDKVEKLTRNSAFALAYVGKKPGSGAVVVDGIVEKCTPEQAAGRIAAAQAMFINWLNTAVENSGMGQLFIYTMHLLNALLRIITSDLGGIRMKGEKAAKAKSKHDRILYELSPWLEKAVILISDEQTRFLNILRDALDNFSSLDPEAADERWDVLDALYHAVKAMPDVLQIPVAEEELRQPVQVTPKNILAGIGAHRGY